MEDISRNRNEETRAAITISATIIIIHRAAFMGLIHGASAYIHVHRSTAKGPGEDAETRRPRDLIGANCPANPVVPLIKSRAVVSPFVSSLNAGH